MSDVPYLSRQDILEQLEHIHFKRPLLAFHGTGEEEVIESSAGERFRVVPVRSQLDLRERLLSVQAGERVVFLVPWTHGMPLDIAGGFHQSGKVLPIGRDARLKRMFDVGELEAEARKSPLADYLLRQQTGARYPVRGGRLTADAMWAGWLQAAWGVELGGGLALDLLLGWAVLDGRGPRFVEAMSGTAEQPVRTALLGHLSERLGLAGPAVWTAWEAGRARALLEHAVLCETLAASNEPAVRMWLKLGTRAVLAGGRDVRDEQVLSIAADLGRAAGTALRHVDGKSGGMARQIVDAADARVDDAEVRAQLIDSTRLLSAWQQRLATLGRRLAAGAAAPSAEAVSLAAGDLHALQGHALFSDPDQTPVFKRAEMAVRLLAWLAARPDEQLARGRTGYAEVETLGRWYADEGGFVDWARRWARGTGLGELGSGVQAVVAAADAARTELDRRFARALPAWHEAGRPAHQVVPIDTAVRRIAVRFVEQSPGRRLLVLLLDGMAWAQAAELLQSLGARSRPWGPLAWHGSKQNRIGDGVYPVVVTNFPSITEVSRSAFFAGAVMAPGKKHDTGKDPERWEGNRDVVRLCAAREVPKLLLRGEGHTRDGSASDEALSLVADTTRQVVAIVINAIDSSLKGDPAERNVWTVEHIRPLADLLEQAREAGRSVLLASDHGHVPADRLEPAGSMQDGARWRAWQGPGEPLAEFEVGLAGEGVWAPRGAHGVAVIADDGHRYGGAAHAGEHGGAALAEAIAPCVLIGREDGSGVGSGAAAGLSAGLSGVDSAGLSAGLSGVDSGVAGVGGVGDDRALEVRPAYVPAWWHFDVHAAVAGAADEPPAQVRPRKQAPANQLSLLDVARPDASAALTPVSPGAASTGAASTPVSTGAVSGAASVVAGPAKSTPVRGPALSPAGAAFAASAVLAARAPRADHRKRVVTAVDFLLQRNGVTSAPAFAAALDEWEQRVTGLVSMLQEVLNIDGYELLRYDRRGRQVILDREMLAQQFEVTL